MADLTVSAAVDTLMQAADQAGIRTAAGLGTLATQNGTFSGTSSGTNTGDQTVPAAANPTGIIGLTAVNGVATSFLRSDGAPALDVGIAPTWTAAHTFSQGTSPIRLTGAWVSSGAGALAQLLVNDPTNAAFAGSASGTGIGANCATAFTGNLIDLQINGSSRFLVNSLGVVNCRGLDTSTGNAIIGGLVVAGNKMGFRPTDLRVSLTSDSLVGWVNSTITTNGTPDLTFSRNAAGIAQIGTTAANASGSLILTGLTATGNVALGKTITAPATTGAQTINQTSGSVNFAAAATSLVVTNSLVTTNSVIHATVATNDTTMKSVAVVAAAGSFTIHANAAATAETRVNFLVTN